MNRYSFSTGALFPLETADAFRMVRDAGFSHVEMMPQAFSDVSESSTRLYETIGLHLNSVHFPLAMFGMLYTAQHSMREDGRRFSLDILKMCQRLDTHILVVHPHEPTHCKGFEALLEQPVVENLLWLADACEQHGVLMAMENSPKTCATSRMLLDYVEKLNHRNIRPMVDTTEACEAGQDPVAFVRDVKPCHLHMSDFNLTSKHLPAGKGDIDWAGIRQALREQEYQGIYTLEPTYRFYLDEVAAKLREAHDFLEQWEGR